MATVLSTFLPSEWTVADMLEHLGGIPPNRIRVVPPPGLATEPDVLDPKSRTLCVYTSPETSVLIREEDSLDGGDVLPGFRITLRDVFHQAAGSPPPGSEGNRPR